MPIELTLLEWLLALGVVLLGTILQGSIGFGVGLLGAPLLFLIDRALVPAPLVLVGFVTPLLILWRERRAVIYRDAAAVVPGAAVGAALGAVALRSISEAVLGVLFGVLVLIAVALSAIHRVPTVGPRGLAVAGSASAFMATTTAVGGPPLALALQNRSGSALRGTMSACFVPLGLLVLLAHSSADRFGLAELIAGVSLLPAVGVGFVVSHYTAEALDRRWLRPTVLAISAVAAVVALVRAAGLAASA